MLVNQKRHLVAYIAFFATVLLTYTLIPKIWKVAFLTGCSYLFYYNLSPRLAVILFILTGLSYVLAIIIERSVDRKRDLVLCSALALVLGSLCYLKYSLFIVENLAPLFHATNFKLPQGTLETVGLSFIVFHITSYLLDVFFETVPAEKSFLDYALYVSFFPKLLQGPLERASEFLPQIKNLEAPRFDSIKMGLRLVLWGLFLKTVVADRIGDFYVNPIYASIDKSTSFEILVAVYSYTLQLYFDFAGYTLIAIGAAQCFGIKLSENFNSPLLATSCTDFWRRWHMTLSSWLRDYLFLPLQMQFRNLGIHGAVLATLITFTLAGLWHGATLGFIIFGLIHGLWLSIEQYANYLLKKRTRLKWLIAGRGVYFVKIIGTYSLVSFSLIFFRSPDINSALSVLESLSQLGIESCKGLEYFLSGVRKALFRSTMESYREVRIFNFLVLLASFCVIGTVSFFKKRYVFDQLGFVSQWLIAEFLLVSIIILGSFSGSNFAYFKF